MAAIEEARRQLMQLLNQDDRFCRCNEIQLTSIGEGCAEAEMPMSEKHLNGLGFAQGGATFTLADLAFAGAANSHGRHAVAMVSNISFLRPGAGSRLFARATEVSRTRRTGLYSIDVTNDQGKLIARVSTNAFFSEERFDFFPEETEK